MTRVDFKLPPGFGAVQKVCLRIGEVLFLRSYTLSGEGTHVHTHTHTQTHTLSLMVMWYLPDSQRSQVF